MKFFFRVILIVAVIVICFEAPSLAADSASFDPTTVSITSQSTIAVGTVIAWPSNSYPSDMGKWLECNGQLIPSDSRYDRLRSVLGSGTVPDYNDQFLRGTTIAADVGKTYQDTLRAHSHEVDPHQHTVSGTASGQSYSGTIPGQTYTDSYITHADRQAYYTTAGLDYVAVIYNHYATRTTSGSSYSGVTAGGTITGITNLSGGGTTHETGDSETAPVHTKVRYLIRSIQ